MDFVDRPGLERLDTLANERGQERLKCRIRPAWRAANNVASSKGPAQRRTCPRKPSDSHKLQASIAAQR